MRPDSSEILHRFRPWQRRFEWGFWIVLYLVNAVANSVTVALDLERQGVDAASWEGVVWETSSALSMLLLVWPVVWITRRWPLQWEAMQRTIAIHLAASVGYSLAHVVLMVGMRELAYALAGSEYSFGHWPSELFYEYLKDVRTYVGVVLMIEGYRFVLRRMQGEARWPDAAAPEIDPEPPRPSRFLVKMLGREFLVPADRIEYASAAGNYVNLHVAGRDYPLRSTMKDLLARLDQDRFRRTHRSHIVNLDFVDQIEPIDSGDARITMRDRSVLPCSRNYRAELTR
ncbi:MAG: LytTR family DNA-binding domain-containing protein [Wenzhouxiangellaceae bacterium]